MGQDGRVPIPQEARLEIAQIQQQLNVLLRGIAIGLGLGSNYRVDLQSMEFIIEVPVEEKKDGKTP